MEAVRPAANAKNIRLTSAFTSMSGTVMGDKNRIQQLVWNLLTNAVKFTAKSGRVHVLIKRVNSHMEICVSDTGEGIAPEFLGQVFDRFRQADPTTTRRHGGLGLGLSIVKQLTELHGGSVRVESEGIGKGATFTVSLPLHAGLLEAEETTDERRTANADEAAAKANLKGTKVLVVDDDLDSVAIVTRTLERNGAEVCATRSMEEALEAFARFSPDIILSDIGMPKHDGYELMSRLRALPNGQRVPAVALTALARSEDRTRALRAGFQMHLPKPVDFDELIAVVQNLAALRSH